LVTIAAGPAAIVLIGVLVGITAGFQAFSSQANLDQLNTLATQLANATANPPDLKTFLDDKTGLYKLNSTFTALTLPEFCEHRAAAPASGHGSDFRHQQHHARTHKGVATTELRRLGRHTVDGQHV